MLVNQIAVFLENRKGRIADFSKILSEAGINIQAMSIADTEEYGILRAVTDDNQRAVKILREGGFNTASTDLLGFEVDDKPGEMHKVLNLLNQNNINIGYLYSFARTSKKKAVILIKVDNNDITTKLLEKNGISLVNEVL